MRGARADSSKGRTLEPNPCEPQRKPLSLVNMMTVLLDNPKSAMAWRIIPSATSTPYIC